jgi:threonine dehydrogenase-like Zn-dependent dehydrogenase
MKALVCDPPSVRLEETAQDPIPQPGESLIQILAAGICRTDLELTKGYMGYQGILGHEFVGQIADDVSPWPRGTRVVGEINAGCADCPWCRGGLERHCPNRSVLGILNRNGCMAEYITLPVPNLVPVPDAISNPHATFIEPVAAALEIFEQLHIQPDQRVCVIGDGKLGLLTAMVMGKKQEGEILQIGHHKNKLEKVEDLVNTCLEKDLPEIEKKSWDVVVEATGKSTGLQLAMQLVKPRGTIVLKSTMANAEALDLTPIVIDEITVLGSRCGQFAPAVSFMEKHRPPLDRLIDGVYPLSDAQQAWDHANQTGVLKILIEMK